MWVSEFGDLKSKDLFTAIKDRIEEPGSELTSLIFVKTCFDECSEYMAILNYSVETLGDARAHVKNILQEIGKTATLPLLLSGVQYLPKKDFKKLCEWILVFIARHSIIANFDSGDFENVVFGLAKDIRAKLPKRKESGHAEIGACMKHIRETLEKASPTDTQLAASSERELSKDGALYVVMKIAEYRHTEAREMRNSESNLEHIFPQSPFPNEWGGLEKQAELEPFLWNIGNLTLMGRRSNTRAGNAEFPAKSEEFSKSKWEITNSIPTHYSEWTPKEIKARAQQMMKHAVEIWSFENSSRV
jgi:hypothetical protein